MRVIALPLLFILVLASIRAATPSPVDLGEGLRYLRIVDAASVPDLSASTPLVLDLRRAQGATPREMTGLRTLLGAAGPARFVLVSRETAPEVLQLLANRAPAVITLAAGSVNPSPDFSVGTAADEDLRAYDAYENGVKLDLLIQPPIRKNRRDEAAIIRNRANGPDGANGNNAAATEDPPPETAAEPAEPSLVDMVLQRAVHLHRGLKALGRL